MIWLLLWAAAIAVAWRIGHNRNRPALIWWGILLGWIGVIFAVCSKPRLAAAAAAASPWPPPPGPRLS